MAKKAATPELDELDAELEDLTAEAEAEAADEGAADDAEVEEEEAPKPKKGKKGKKGKGVEAVAASDGPIGSKDLAAALGTDGRNLRVMLRDKGANAKKDEETGRYVWPSLEAALKALGFADLDEAKTALKEARDKRLNKLKEDSAAKREADNGDADTPKKKKKGKKNKAA